MGMKLASKFIGAWVVKSQLFKLIKGVLSVADLKRMAGSRNPFEQAKQPNYLAEGQTPLLARLAVNRFDWRLFFPVT
eukprot:856920-Pelagomonas_calceolata.AAC.1